MPLSMRLIHLFLYRHRKAILAFWLTLIGVFIFRSYLSWQNGEVISLPPFMVLTGLFCLYLASSSFQELSDKLEAHFLLLLPTSAIKHFLIRNLTTLVTIPVISAVTLMLIALAFDVMGADVQYRPISGAGLLIFLALHSIYAAGGLAFRNAHFFMTTTSIFGTLLIGSTVAMALIIFTLLDFTDYGRTPFDVLLADTGKLLESLTGILKLCLAMIITLFYLYSFFRFKEFEMD